MATAYKATKAQAGVQPRTLPTGQVISVYSEYSLTAALVINDTIEIGTIPAGATMLGLTVASDDIDSSTGLVFSAGDASDYARFISGSTVGQAVGFQEMNVVTGFGYAYTATTKIYYKCTTAPTTGTTSGKIRFGVRYTMDP